MTSYVLVTIVTPHLVGLDNRIKRFFKNTTVHKNLPFNIKIKLQLTPTNIVELHTT